MRAQAIVLNLQRANTHARFERSPVQNYRSPIDRGDEPAVMAAGGGHFSTLWTKNEFPIRSCRTLKA
jgi:hypothetical protein